MNSAMKRTSKLSPSILSCDFTELGSAIRLMENSGIDWLHLDIMDGHFIPNISFGIPVTDSIHKKSNLFLDTHLMISEPEKYIEPFIKVGADLLTVHIEVCSDIRNIINKIKRAGAQAGVSLNPDTPVDKLSDILDITDLILVMSVHPGFGGQSFIPECIDKVRWLRKKIDDAKLDTIIEIDGGINQSNIRTVTDAGADRLVIGSAIFLADNPELKLKQYMQLANGDISEKDINETNNIISRTC